jgi:hypothetical protein
MTAALSFRCICLAALLAGACAEVEDEAVGTASEPVAGSSDQPVSSPDLPAAPSSSVIPDVDSSQGADCNALEAERFIGREATAPVRAELAHAAAPVAAIRWVGPGDATTEDYSLQRLNVMLDVGGLIVSAHCG